MLCKKERFGVAILFILLAILLGGCAGAQIAQDRTIKEYFLKDAGFSQMDATTPRSQILMAATPKGQFVSYGVEGEKYYVYATESDLYLGNEAAYQKYLSMVRDRRLCQSLDATDWEPFWACFEEYQKGASGK